MCFKVFLKVSSENHKFVLDWVDPYWGQWELLVNDAQFKNLEKEAQDKLTKAQSYMDMGKGKGIPQIGRGGPKNQYAQNQYGKGKGKTGKHCTNCRKDGHTRSECWAKGG